MNHKISITALTILFVASALPILAEEVTPTLTPKPTVTPVPTITTTPKPFGWVRSLFNGQKKELKNELKNEQKEERQDLQTTITQKRNELQGTITLTRLESNQKHVQATYQGLYNSFQKRFTALMSYLDRIQVRLTDKKAKLPGNQNLIDSQAAVDNAKGALKTKFDTDLASFKTQAEQIIASGDPKSLVPQLKTAAKLVETDLKTIRSELVNALRLMVKAK